MQATDLRYPIGLFEPQPFNNEVLTDWKNNIRFLPQTLENSILNLDEHQLETPYREGGWTVKQLVHHIADSHMNAYCRFKLGLTESTPIIKPYDEQLWAELPDTKNLPINISITLLFALHARWYEIINGISDSEWNRSVIHPAQHKEMTLWYLLGLYSWHGRHHVAHIDALRNRMSW